MIDASLWSIIVNMRSELLVTRVWSSTGIRVNSTRRESREYYGKGKGKMVDAADSKWVKVAERGSRKPPPHHGYRGEGEGSRYKNTRRDDGRHGFTGGGFGDQESRIRPSSEQSRDDLRQRVRAPEAREDGEIKSFQLE
ncbi:hypothetical protein IGI04_029976 [Brassica rapa subsp. trilocularis]|uniref:Btz domain-containing protein n=1 Tax=Brassica rapa subsp. trilocularis TaxID=1813537 RepID=A0ABQ7KJC6_BRACM|nr:hypothetical protein IGI04_042395 [Brassica rapa subsp. trilocularis]KAG5388435.1 hypothetical protein IGI04_029976 [Brassica rapa subsp. trilocularis]